ncbi:unnamed protein product [Adineta ricciae]|uniref:Uncharacterized protein n=1 Tax=Adineta ricciae TaxID=249248 RepID=A0A813Z110_ADIRI|nr:unnamed protein product [Adineta ricciae]CAF1180454.1 unnamed protein product [Adineta ricciae]
MFASSLITDDNHVPAGSSNFDRYELQNDTTNCQQLSSSGHASASLVPQPDSWPHQSKMQRSASTTSQTFIPSAQFDSNTWNFSSLNVNAGGCGDSHANSDQLFGTESILQQAVPGTLAVPRSWHSEIVGSTSSTYKNDIDSQSINDTDRSVYEKQEEYKTLNTTDGPPVIFSSRSETNRFLNELPPSSLITSNGTNTRNSAFAEFKNTPIDESFEQNKNVVLTEEQRAAIANIDTQQPPPMIIRKKATASDMMYQQNISVRYLQPPTPPPPGPIIIREVRPPPTCPKSPIHIRQRPAPSRTPPPLIFRERPPPIPPRPPCQVIEKLLPPPPRPPRRLIVEQLGPCPPKPSDVIIERWLPYRRNDQRRIFYERVPTTYRPPSPNVLVMHGSPQARIHKEFINQGVSRADPNYYLQHYGHEINSSQLHSQYAHIIDEATRTLPPPPLPPPPPHPSVEYHTYNPSDSNFHSHPSPSFISNIWERMKSAAPYPSPGSYQNNYPSYNQQNSPYPYTNPPPYSSDPRAVPPVVQPWSGHNYPSPSLPLIPPSPYQSIQPTQTIQVQSDTELHRVLSGLTNGRVPTPLRAY